MKRADLLRAIASLPILGALVSSPAQQVEEYIGTRAGGPYAMGGTSFQLARIVGNRAVDLAEETPGVATFRTISAAVQNGFNYIWQYTLRDGVRYVDGLPIGETAEK